MAATDGHLIHATCHGRNTATTAAAAAAGGTGGINLAQVDAAVFVLCGHLLPLLDLGHASASNGFERVGHGLTGLHILQLKERDGNQTGTPQATYGFGDEPFGVGQGDDDDGLASAGLQLIRSLGLEIILHDAVNHGSRTFTHC